MKFLLPPEVRFAVYLWVTLKKRKGRGPGGAPRSGNHHIDIQLHSNSHPEKVNKVFSTGD